MSGVSRRAWLAAAAGGLCGRSALAAVPPTGWIKPRLAPPALTLTASDGRRVALPSLLAGKVTALQLMFTGCSTTCPPQAALFAALAERMPDSGFQLLSISIDPLGDGPGQLAGWLKRFGQPAGWSAAVPAVAEVERVASFLRGVPASAGTHTAQVFVADRDGRLCYRTGDVPAPAFVAALLNHVAHGG